MCSSTVICGFSAAPAYVHMTSNNTIFGTQWAEMPDTGAVPLVADMSSDILWRPIDVSRFGLIYAGAQKNIGPAGLTVVIVRDDLVGQVLPNMPVMFDYKIHADADSMYNTPPCFAIYIVGLVLNWLKANGGVEGIARVNAENLREGRSPTNRKSDWMAGGDSMPILSLPIPCSKDTRRSSRAPSSTTRSSPGS